jgi:hypothetical protein
MPVKNVRPYLKNNYSKRERERQRERERVRERELLWPA